MLSAVSVISLHLMTALSAPSVDSGRVAISLAPPELSAPMRAEPATLKRLLATASRHLGTRYRMGGTTPAAFDCSGFVRYVFARHGVRLPRTAREQSLAGEPVVVGPDSLRVGDLLFFHTRRGRAGHVAIYAGGGRIIHASSGSHRVRYDDFASPRGRWFIEHLSMVRRVVGVPGTTSPAPAEPPRRAGD